MEALKPNPVIRLLPSLTDLAFLMPAAFVFLRMNGAPGMLGDGDTGWHVRTGEWILANGRVPSQDIFSYTKAGERWFAWEWLWDVSFAWMYRHGGMAAVVLASLLVISATSVLLFRLVRRRCGNALIAIGVMFLVTGGCAIHYLARPHLFTFLFIVIFYSILERVREGEIRLLWWLPALTVLWTNIHGAFFVGIFLAGAYAVGELISAVTNADSRQRLEAARRSKPYLMAAGGCLLASFINPYTYHLHRHIVEYLTDKYQYQSIGEFQSFNFHHPVTMFFEPMLLAAFGAAVWSLIKRQYVYAILILGWAHLALTVVRNEPIFMLLAGLPVAVFLESMVSSVVGANVAGILRRTALHFRNFSADFTATDSISRAHVTSFAALALLTALFYAPHPPANCRAEYDARHYPAKAVEMLQKAGAPETIFTDDEWGDYLIYRLYPGKKVFIDGRSDFYGPKFNQKYLDVMNVRYDWESNLNRYHVDTILLPPNSPLAATLKESRHWHPIYDDGVAIVFRAGALGGRNQVSVVSSDGKYRDHRIAKPQPGDRTITISNLRSEPS